MSAPALDPGLADDLRALRRDLHRHPELGLDNPRTQARILQELEGLGFEITLGRELSSVVAVLRGRGGGGRAVLLIDGHAYSASDVDSRRDPDGGVVVVTVPERRELYDIRVEAPGYYPFEGRRYATASVTYRRPVCRWSRHTRST